jgi:hypothetical protein
MIRSVPRRFIRQIFNTKAPHGEEGKAGGGRLSAFGDNKSPDATPKLRHPLGGCGDPAGTFAYPSLYLAWIHVALYVSGRRRAPVSFLGPLYY